VMGHHSDILMSWHSDSDILICDLCSAKPGNAHEAYYCNKDILVLNR